MTLSTPTLIAVILTAALAAPPPGGPSLPGDDAIERFLTQTSTPLTSAVTFRHLEATARSGSLRGWLDVCTSVEGSEMRYSIVGQGGSGAVRKRALIAALDGEVKARRRGETSRASLHPDNYEFIVRAEAPAGLVPVALRPRRSDGMLIRGTMYLAPEDGDLVRVEGALVKAPSVWTRRVRVDRRYARVARVRVPVSMTSTASVLVVGESTFSMAYSYLAINGAPVVDSRAPEAARACTAAATAGSAHQPEDR